MPDVVSTLKSEARRLHRGAAFGDCESLARLRRLPALKGLETEYLLAVLRRRHCLAVLARELGFLGWPHALRVLQGEAVEDFGTLLYRGICGAHLNIWARSHEEARQIHARHGGYLLAYRRQFLIVEADYLRSLGLDPEDPDWERLGRDWTRPGGAAARRRLYGKLIGGQSVGEPRAA